MKSLVLKSIDNSFLDAQVFYIDVIPKEYEKVIKYLQNNKSPPDYSKKQQRRLILKKCLTPSL